MKSDEGKSLLGKFNETFSYIGKYSGFKMNEYSLKYSAFVHSVLNFEVRN